jgi:hypothetical protein
MSSQSLISLHLLQQTQYNNIHQSSLIFQSLHFNKTNPYNKTKMVIKKIMKKIDLRCRSCDNNPLRKSSESSENLCRFFARGIILAQVLALQFANFPGSWQRGIVAAPQ